MNILVRRLPALLVLAAIVIPSLSRAQGFEGVVTNNITVPMLGDQKIPVIVSSKGNKTLIAMDVPMQGNVRLFLDKTSPNKIVVVMDAQKSGIEMDQTAIENSIKNKSFPVPTATGKKEKISGYNAEEFSAGIDAGAVMSLWMTKEAPKNIADAVSSSFQGTLQINNLKTKSFDDLFKQGYIPVRTVIKKDGETQVMIDFASAESKKLDDNIFVVPADIKIKKVDPSMMQQQNMGDDDSATQAAAPVDSTKAAGKK
jgi:hypothetical protein